MSEINMQYLVYRLSLLYEDLGRIEGMAQVLSSQRKVTPAMKDLLVKNLKAIAEKMGGNLERIQQELFEKKVRDGEDCLPAE